MNPSRRTFSDYAMSVDTMLSLTRGLVLRQDGFSAHTEAALFMTEYLRHSSHGLEISRAFRAQTQRKARPSRLAASFLSVVLPTAGRYQYLSAQGVDGMPGGNVGPLWIIWMSQVWDISARPY